jgi:RHS repeat-associated protein
MTQGVLRSQTLRAWLRRVSHPAGATLAAFLVALASSVPVHPDNVANSAAGTPQTAEGLPARPAMAAGQSATMLADGRWLLVGGVADPRQLEIYDPTLGQTDILPVELAQPRSGQSATLLPDGTVFIYGGIGPDGSILDTAEEFTPSTSTVSSLGAVGLQARAYQSGTMLRDGQVLLAGGVGADGQPLAAADVYDPSTRSSTAQPTDPSLARLNPTATLLPGGTVLISGGTDAKGQGFANALVFDPSVKTLAPADANAVQAITNSLTSSNGPSITLSVPASGAVDTPVEKPLVVLFSDLMAPSTLNEHSVTLIGPQGVVVTTVTAVEQGRALFVSPHEDLVPGSNYTLFISGARDATGRRPLPFTALGFSTTTLGVEWSPPAQKITNQPGGISVVKTPLPPTRASAVPTAPQAKAQAPSTAPAAAAQKKPTTASTAPPPAPVANPPTSPEASVDYGERWVPTQQNYSGRWISRHRHIAELAKPQNDQLRRAIYGNPEIPAAMKKMSLADVAAGKLSKVVAPENLTGPTGITGVTGQVMRLNGKPLAHVTLSIGTKSVLTDANGEFMLANVPAGHQVLVIDGTTANQGGHQYGRYEYGMNLADGLIHALPFVIWMTALDTEHATTISSPTAGPTVITDPEIPGLQLRLPAGTVIRDATGKIVTSISITAIPVDQPPFPLPQVPVPTYFTIQPGGAYIEASGSQVSSGAQLVYPNFTHSPAGTRFNFWNYDATGKGWYIYGQGTVSPDATQVIPDPGVVIYEFSGAMVSLPSNEPSLGPTLGGLFSPDPVDFATGLFLVNRTDLTVGDVIPIQVGRSYRPQDPTWRAFGVGTGLIYDMYLVGASDATASSEDTYTYQDLVFADGSRVHYVRISPGTSWWDAVYENISTPGPLYGSIIQSQSGLLQGEDTMWWLTLKDGTVIGFPDSDGSTNFRDAAAQWIQDRNGNLLLFTRDFWGDLTQIDSPNNRHLYLQYNAVGNITQASDDLGHTVTYSYDSQGRLISVKNPLGNSEQYNYDSNNNLLVVTDARGNASVTNTYDSSNRVITQAFPDGTTASFAYNGSTCGSASSQTTYTDQRGTVYCYSFNSSGYTTQVTAGVGLSQQQTTTITRDPTANSVLSETDALNRTTTVTYDVLGNPTSVTWLSGTPNAVIATAQYNPWFSVPTVVTDVNGNSTQLSYDAVGNLLSVTDALGHTTTLTYDSLGRTLTATDANGNAASAYYVGADLRSVTDALGDARSQTTNAIGWTTGLSLPLGGQIAINDDALGRPLSVTDPNGATLQQTYDPNGNVLTRIDANNHTTAFTYDAMNRKSTMTDALSQSESYVYEPGGRVSRFTDRKAQVAGWSYDALGRPTQIGYGATSTNPTAYTGTLAKTWDAGNRVTQLVDSSSGSTITRTYDGLDRVTQEVTPQGTVNYTYDAGGRRTSMSVSGQPTITYSWDSANRLTQIQQAAGAINGNVAQTIGFQYDNANRRTQLTLPNGVTVNYAYDAANRLTGITYTQSSGTTLGTLTYTYDADGRRTSVGGTLANLALPSAMTGAYDANNRMTTFNATSLTYDADGNLTNDGSNSYTWDARNRLQSLSGGVTAAFAYDALGRRAQKVVASATTGFLYDGPNYVQEQGTGGSVSAALITGGTDETFARSVGGSTNSLLSDALGSTLAETSSAQSITTNYSFDPYGTTTQTGTTTGNAQQYTGRENDGTGLYYYRARYYSPKLGRFISEDPARMAGGPNFYAYALGNPLAMRDPSGLCSQDDQLYQALTAVLAAAMFADLAGDLLVSDLLYSAISGLGLLDISLADLAFGEAGGFGLAAGAEAGAETTATSVFYTGGTRATAEAWAAANGGQTMATSAFAVAESATPDVISTAAQGFARSATGNVVVFQPASVVPLNSYWALDEFPALMNNQSVTSITYQLVDSSGNIVQTLLVPK